MSDFKQENTDLQNRAYPNPATAIRDCRTAARPSKPPAVLAPRLMTMTIIMMLVSVVVAATAKAQELRKEDNSASVSSSWRFEFGPGGQLYPVYIANPIRPQMGIALAHFSDSDIPNAEDERVIIRLGANAGLLRFSPTDKPDSGFQLNVEAGFIGAFDIENSLDNIGWDGLYGILLSWSNGRGFAAQTGIKHVSSHVGDEYVQRTGRKRISYTRGEYVLGLSLACQKYWRIYGEGGYAYEERNEQLQEPWRLEAGLEFQDPHRFWGNRFGWYAAGDFNWHQESDWSTDFTVQAGLIVVREKLFRTFRFGLEYRNGRSVLGEFFFRNETYISLGLWCDL